MITFFSNPRPFEGPFKRIQENAILSWKASCPGCQIILFEDEQGTTRPASQRLGVQFVEGRQTSRFGTPLLNSSYDRAREAAQFAVMVQISTDIILTDDFPVAVERVRRAMDGKPFFMAGRRWDVNLESAIDFRDRSWQDSLVRLARREGKIHRPSAMDYWVMPKDFTLDFPPFAIGRPGTDSWLVYRLRSLGIPVIDATGAVFAIHQNHPYPRKAEDSFVLEKKENLALAGGFLNLMTLREADWTLAAGGLSRPRFPENIFSALALWYPWRLLVLVKRIVDAARKKW